MQKSEERELIVPFRDTLMVGLCLRHVSGAMWLILVREGTCASLGPLRSDTVR